MATVIACQTSIISFRAKPLSIPLCGVAGGECGGRAGGGQEDAHGHLSQGVGSRTRSQVHLLSQSLVMFARINMRRRPRSRSSIMIWNGASCVGGAGRAEHEYGTLQLMEAGRLGMLGWEWTVHVWQCKQLKSTQTSHHWNHKNKYDRCRTDASMKQSERKRSLCI